MFRFLPVLLCGLILCSGSASARMPIYDTTDYYNQCFRINSDMEECAKQDTSRLLNEIKKQYRTIITTPNIIGWHKELAQNTATMRDMYESWTAYRNRLCSLSHKSAQYLEKIVEEKVSCHLYYAQHHNAHLDSIIKLLTGPLPENRGQFKYLYIPEHDSEYESCKKEKKQVECVNEELTRTTKRIKNLYQTLLEDEYLGKWNNGPDLKNGNYRDLYDSWIAYRNRMCSLSDWAYEVGYGKNAMYQNYCLLFFNIENLDALGNILVSAHSSLDEEIVPENDDGGEAEGKTIKPLERRFDSTQNKSEALVVETPQKPAAKADETPKTPQNKINVPTWAQ